MGTKTPAEKSIVMLEGKALDRYEHIAKQYEMDIQDIVAIKNVAFPDIDITHFMVAMNIAKKYDLDPSVKEIYGWEKGGRVTIVASNAGFLKIARKQPGFIKIISNAVYAEDDFEMDMLNDTISKHIIHPEKRTKDSTPLGAYAILRTQDQPDQVKWVDWNEYAQVGEYSPWRKQKAAMICKCATSVLCREAYGLSGLYGEEEMEQETFEDKAKKTKMIEKINKESEGLKTKVVEDEEINEAEIQQVTYRSKMQEYFLECETSKVAPFIEKPDFASYTEDQAKKDFLILQQH